MVDFGGWNMPVQYSSILEEHAAVRTGVGLFDVSHMGEIEVRGRKAAKLVDYVSTNHAAKLKTGQAHYSALLYEHGGFVDDILVHKVADDNFFLCVNASNQEKDFEHIRSQNRFDAEVEFSSDRYAQLAVQGPRARDIVQKLTPVDLGSIKYYWFTDGEVLGIPARIAHTGYTGEDGFEIFCQADRAVKAWTEILERGAQFGIKPCGLGARDTWRLEMCYPLNGSDLAADTTPLEAGLSIFVDLQKPEFIGRQKLVQQRQDGVKRRLVPFKMTGQSPPPRSHYAVFKGDTKIAETTSGTLSPSLKVGIGMAYIPTELARIGEQIQVEIRGQRFNGVIEKKPLIRPRVEN
jgi:aminomethyltransferase